MFERFAFNRCIPSWSAAGPGAIAAGPIRARLRWQRVKRCGVVVGFEIEELGRDVLVGIHSAHEPSDLAARDSLDGVAKVPLARVLEEQPHVAQALVLAHRGHRLLRRRQRLLSVTSNMSRAAKSARALVGPRPKRSL